MLRVPKTIEKLSSHGKSTTNPATAARESRNSGGGIEPVLQSTLPNNLSPPKSRKEGSKAPETKVSSKHRRLKDWRLSHRGEGVVGPEGQGPREGQGK